MIVDKNLQLAIILKNRSSRCFQTVIGGPVVEIQQKARGQARFLPQFWRGNCTSLSLFGAEDKSNAS